MRGPQSRALGRDRAPPQLRRPGGAVSDARHARAMFKSLAANALYLLGLAAIIAAALGGAGMIAGQWLAFRNMPFPDLLIGGGIVMALVAAAGALFHLGHRIMPDGGGAGQARDRGPRHSGEAGDSAALLNENERKKS